MNLHYVIYYLEMMCERLLHNMHDTVVWNDIHWNNYKSNYSGEQYLIFWPYSNTVWQNLFKPLAHNLNHRSEKNWTSPHKPVDEDDGSVKASWLIKQVCFTMEMFWLYLSNKHFQLHWKGLLFITWALVQNDVLQ